MGKPTTRDVVIAVSAGLTGIATALATLAGANTTNPPNGADVPALTRRIDGVEAKLDGLMYLACKQYPEDTLCAKAPVR